MRPKNVVTLQNSQSKGHPRVGGLDGIENRVGVGSQEVAPRQRQGGKLGKLGGPVDSLEPSVPGVLQHPGPDLFGFSDDHRVGVPARFLRQQRGVMPTHDHGNAAGAVGIGDLVGAQSLTSHPRDPHHVGLAIEVDRLDVLVDDLDVDARRGGRRHHRQAQGRELNVGLLDCFLPTRCDQSDFHRRISGVKLPLLSEPAGCKNATALGHPREPGKTVRETKPSRLQLVGVP